MTDTPQDATRDPNEPMSTDPNGLDVSPSVRRLLRQYDLDATAIRGSGPNGKIKPGDVLAAVGNPQTVPNPDGGPAAARAALRADPETQAAAAPEDSPVPEAVPHEPVRAPIATTIFVCNMSRVLAHRTRAGLGHVSTACYVARAAAAAAHPSGLTVPDASHLPLAVVLGDRSATLRLSVGADDDPAEIQTRLTAELQAAEQDLETDRNPVRRLVIHHRNLPGNLLDLHEPAGHGELATLGVGGLQRTIALTVTDGTEAPRVVVQCHLSFTYRPDEIGDSTAARFIGECVRILESWPLPETSAADKPAAASAAADGAPAAADGAPAAADSAPAAEEPPVASAEPVGDPVAEPGA